MNKNYKAALEEAANKSINRNMYELHEADARVRQYKLGADFSFNYQQAEIEKLRAELTQETKEWNETVAQLNEAATEYALENTKLGTVNQELSKLCCQLSHDKAALVAEAYKLRADRAILVRCFEFLVESSQISIFSTEKGSEAFKLYEKLKRDAE